VPAVGGTAAPHPASDAARSGSAPSRPEPDRGAESRAEKGPVPPGPRPVQGGHLGEHAGSSVGEVRPADEVGDWGPAVGWDGPVSIYKGPFTSADGKQAAKARVYFRRSGGSSVVALVEFVNQ